MSLRTVVVWVVSTGGGQLVYAMQPERLPVKQGAYRLTVGCNSSEHRKARAAG
mgnify:CR=1 FL=1